uniref:NAD-dependent epimerase/dehydratase family protein n=1 Tax=Candidatus Electrothrix sp. TaxID=2170559 RepID=UPI0040567D73
MRVVITGASGFVGSHLAFHLLRKKYQVKSLNRKPGGTGFKCIDLKTGTAFESSDDNLAEYFQGADAVVHLAAKQVDNLGDPLHIYIEPNVVLTEKLVLNAIKAGVKRLVFASTRLLYPESCKKPFVESCPHEPDTMYGMSKKIGENIIDFYTRKTNATGISLRLGQIFGPNNYRGIVGNFIQQATNYGRLNVFGKGTAIRDFVYIKDAVSAFDSAIQSNAPSGEYNIGSGRGYSIKEIAIAVSEVFLDGEQSIQYSAVENEDQTRYVMDCAKAFKSLGWQPKWFLKEALLDIRDTS